MIKLDNITKIYNKNKDNEIKVISDLSLEFNDTGLVTILGKSGCGKTTLLNVIGGLDSVDSGSITIDDVKIDKYDSKIWDDVRCKKIGYIFQNYNLFNDKAVYENLEIALNLIGLDNNIEKDNRIDYALRLVGLGKYKLRLPNTMSGGQQQRVGIARAIVKGPTLLLADEPTGNLDSKNTLEIMKILKEISKTCLVIMVTHEEKLASIYADRIIRLKDGFVVSDKYNNEAEKTEENQNLYNKAVLKPVISAKKGSAIDNKEALKIAYRRYLNEPKKQRQNNFNIFFLAALIFVISIAYVYGTFVYNPKNYKSDPRIMYVYQKDINFYKPLIGQYGIESIHPIGEFVDNTNEYINSSNMNSEIEAIGEFYPLSRLENLNVIVGAETLEENEVYIDINYAKSCLLHKSKKTGITDMKYFIGEKVSLGIYKSEIYNYRIAGIIEAKNSVKGVYMRDEDLIKVMDTLPSTNLAIISNDKKASTKYLETIGVYVFDPYKMVSSDFVILKKISGGISLALFIIIFTFVIYVTNKKIKAEFYENIKYLGTLRCIGANKREVSKEFMFESLIFTTICSLPGYLLGSVALKILEEPLALYNITFFFYPWWLLFLALFFLYGLNLLITKFTVYRYLKKTPQELMTKYDI